jgi:hypothetical protein
MTRLGNQKDEKRVAGFEQMPTDELSKASLEFREESEGL